MKLGPALNEKNLVFGFDTGRNPSSGFDHRVRGRRYFKGKNTVNFFPDGHFPDGTDMSTEGDSNPTNTIVELKNPGDSKYVLRQTMGNANTEYQIRLTTQLSASTTYTLSGWYAESNDYSGASRMFHCRAYSTGGSHRSLGTGIYNVIATKIVGGLTWKYCYANITTPSDYSNNFYWFVGYSSSTYSGARYYTNLKMEQGSYPTPYHAGTRSSTNSLIDLTKTSTIDVSNVSFDSTGLPTFDGTDDKLTLTGFNQPSDPNNFSVEAIVNLSAHNSNTNIGSVIVNNYSSLNGWIFFLNGPSSTLGLRHHNGTTTAYNVVYGTGINLNQWYHIAGTDDGTTVRLYINGEQVQSGSSSSATNYSGQPLIGQFPGNNAVTTGKIPVVKIYDRALTDREIKANYNQYKNRFNL